MATISQIRDAIGTRLLTLDQMRVQDEFGEDPPVSANACVAVVQYAGATYDSVFGGQGDALLFGVIVLVSRGSDRIAIDTLDALSDPSPGSTTSVRNAVNGSLGGVVAAATVATGSDYKDYPIGEQSYVGVEFVVQVMT